MIRIRRSNERGHADHGWLNSYHTFSFANYYDPAHMGFRDLRVINEDRVAPDQGFGTHGHRDMEIISYVVGGQLAHRDSMGNGSTLNAGDVQRLTAGTGVRHSELNPSKDDSVHFLQIWLLPERDGLEPGYEEKHFSADDKRDRLRPIVTPDARDGSLKVNQDIALYASNLSAGTSVQHELADGRHAWVQVVAGDVTVGGETLTAGDGAAISDVTTLDLTADSDAELLLFDLA